MPWSRSFAPLACALTALASFSACKKSAPDASAPSPPVIAPNPALAAPTDELSKKVEALTGARTRAVWSHHTSTKSADPFSSGTSHQLHGFDSRDGNGVRTILEDKGNYSRPLISPDGSQIVFTRKLVTRLKETEATKNFDMTVMLTDWSGSEPRELVPGYALDVWQDPATGHQWVYAAQDVPPTHRIAWSAKKLVRFRLDEPATVEIVWDQTDVSPDNTQLSADGKRASGQTPWPHGGQYVIESGEAAFEPTITGCWAGMAPDNSYVSWMLDGSHRIATLSVLAPAKKSWRLNFNQIAGLEKGEIYHPRWSNHPRFITLTGPYLAEHAPGEGSIISKGGLTAEVVIAKLNPAARGFEGSVTLTQNETNDAYPDVWIENAQTSTLGDFPQGLAVAKAAAEWPADKGNLVFLWEALGQPNQVRSSDGRNLECHLEPKGTALFGPRLDMQLATGAFEPSALSRAHLELAMKSTSEWTLETMLLPPYLPAAKQPLSGSLLSLPGWSIAFSDGALTVNQQRLANPPLRLPSHLAFRYDGRQMTVFINGSALAPIAIQPDKAQQACRFGGDAPLLAGLQGIAFHSAALDDNTLAASHLFWQSKLGPVLKQKAPRVRLRGKLAETTGIPTPEGIDPYTRAMVSYVYDVEQVLAGDFDGKQILVCHWALMDLKPCAGLPRQPGASFDLLVEPLDIEKHHPELKGQRVLDDTSAFDLQAWYDITPPQPQ